MRVVTLLPSATEIVYALGVQPVGVSHECDHPPAAANLPVVNRSRIDAQAGSAEIDTQVQAASDEGGVYEIDRERLAGLDPDLVVSQGICDVCAVDEVLVREAVADLGLDADVVTTDPHTLEDVLADVVRLGKALDRQATAQHLKSALESRIETITDHTESGPRVAVLDWLDPPMVAGHWIPGMVNRAGGSYGLAEPGARSRPRNWDELLDYDPEILIAAPCGFDIEQTLTDSDCLTDRRGWADLKAVRRGDVYVMDGHHYVNRPGPRLVDTLEAFRAAVTGRADEVDGDLCRHLGPVPA